MKKMLVMLSVFITALTAVGCGSTTTAGEEQGAQEVQQEQTVITDDQAVTAIRNYCYEVNPGLEELVNGGEYEVEWYVESGDENMIVVVYRSYTAALIRYYIDPNTGDTYVTEYVPGITEEEMRTEETLNVRDYLE